MRDATLPGMTDEELLRQARRRVGQRFALGIHAAIYVLVNACLVVVWRVTDASYPWFIWPLLGWGVGLAAHALVYFFGPTSRRGDRAIEREIERLRRIQLVSSGAANTR
jgi:hypothetical protein